VTEGNPLEQPRKKGSLIYFHDLLKLSIYHGVA
ncbi:MAG: hypothetical protein RLZZ74_2440, partial [Cyanobacteriota bacterium]